MDELDMKHLAQLLWDVGAKGSPRTRLVHIRGHHKPRVVTAVRVRGLAMAAVLEDGTEVPLAEADTADFNVTTKWENEDGRG